MPMSWRLSVPPLPAATWPGRVSIPLPPGTPLPGAFSVCRPDGSRVAAQARVLVPWPDGSPRWVQLDFPLNGPGEATIVDEPAATTADGLLIEHADGATLVCSGDLSLTVDPAVPGGLRRLAFAGRDLAGTGDWRFTAVDTDGRRWPLAPVAGTALVEAVGTHRFQLAWMARHERDGQPLLDVRLRLEVLAGTGGFTLACQHIHALPGHDYLTLRSLEADLAFPGLADGNLAVQQQSWSNIGLPRTVRRRQPVTMHLDGTRLAPYVASLTEIDDDFDYPYFLRAHATSMGTGMVLDADGLGLLCQLRHCRGQRPKRITVAPGRLTIALWPEEAGPLVMPQGRSYRHVFRFTAFPANDASIAAHLARPDASALDPVLCWLAPDDAAAAGPTWIAAKLLRDDTPHGGIFSHILKQGTAGLHTVMELEHLGDSPEPGYCHTYAGVGHAPPGADGVPPSFRFDESGAHWLFHGTGELPTVWCNNEYDTIYCLALEALRTRQPAVVQKLTLFARHQLEVDFVHYSDHWQHHRGTPAHTYGHTQGSAIVASHQWTQGLYYYYALTGDDDVPEVVRAICDYDIAFIGRRELTMNHGFNRELGWAAIALVFGYECTGDARYRDAAGEVLRELDEHWRAAGEGDRRSGYAGRLGATFDINTIPLAAAVYHQATGDAWARDRLTEWVRFGLRLFHHRASGPKLHDLFPEPLCYLWELTGDDQLLRDTLWHLTMFMQGHQGMLGFVPFMGPSLNAKTYARGHRGVLTFTSACARAGLLAEAERRCLGES